MKIAGARIDAFVQKPDPGAMAILVYGPDGGLVNERAKKLMATVVEDINDPFNVAQIDGAELKADPAKLLDEANAISMMGGRRTVRIREATDGLSKIFEGYLEEPGDALIVVDAGDLSARSSLRKLFEGADNAAALPCYADDGRSLEQVIREMMYQNRLRLEPEAETFLLHNLGSDRMVTRQELEKLVLYMGQVPEGQSKTITLKDAELCVGDNAALSLDEVSIAVAAGDQDRLDLKLDRALSSGNNPVAILRTVSRHFQRLHFARALMDNGVSLDSAMGQLRPPVFFKMKAPFKAQLNKWTTTRLTTALDLLLQAESDCKTTGMPAETICKRILMRLTHAAAGPRR